jgi:hypothetical protein
MNGTLVEQPMFIAYPETPPTVIHFLIGKGRRVEYCFSLTNMVVPTNAKKRRSSSNKKSGRPRFFKWSTLWNAQSKFMLDHYDAGENFEGQNTDGSESREDAFNSFCEEMHKTKAKYKSEPYKYNKKTKPIAEIPVSTTTDLYGIERFPSDFLLYSVIGLSILVFCVGSHLGNERV